MNDSEMCTCSECGYQWPKDCDGRHSCVYHLKEKLREAEYKNEILQGEQDLLKLGSGPAKDIKDNYSELIIGAFYEKPDGSIVRTWQSDKRSQDPKDWAIGYHMDSIAIDFRVHPDEALTWKLRRDLADYPNAVDPRLPFEFDLLWDIKYTSQLKGALEEGGSDAEEIRECMEKYEISLE